MITPLDMMAYVQLSTFCQISGSSSWTGRRKAIELAIEFAIKIGSVDTLLTNLASTH